MTKKRKFSLVALGLLISLVLILGSGVLPIAAESGSPSTVGMVIDPTPKTVTAGNTFSVDIKVTITDDEPVNTAEAHINFVTTYLEVVSITAGTTLPVPLQSTFSNTAGTIDYVAGATLGSPAPTETFVLATLNLRAKAVTAATPLTFVYISPLRNTEAYVGLAVPSLTHSAVFNGSVIINPAAATQLAVTGVTDPVAAGTASSVTVTAKDAYGNVATGYTGTIHFTSSDTQATLPADYTFQASDNGVKTFSGGVTLKTAGEQWVKATDTVTATITGQQAAITVNPAAAVASKLVVSGITDPINAGTASSVTVTAVDSFGNTVTGYTGTIHFTSSDGKATLPANYTFQAGDHGVKTFSGGVTLKTAGEQWVKATDTVTATITGQQAGITVTGEAGGEGKGTNWGAIVGGIVGGALLLIIAFLLLRPRKKRR